MLSRTDYDIFLGSCWRAAFPHGEVEVLPEEVQEVVDEAAVGIEQDLEGRRSKGLQDHHRLRPQERPLTAAAASLHLW